MQSETAIEYSDAFPKPPARLFLVGIGGIGMSGLAQFLVHQGYAVAGSDRGLSEPDRQELFGTLRAQGIELFPQDGSGPRAFQPDGFVFTTAIEPGNPDQCAAPKLPVFHRAFVLARLCKQAGGKLIGIAGTCGKTSVTGWIGSALNALGKSIILINGGYLPEFETPEAPGNFYAATKGGQPEFVVAEIDESDRSIREFSPDYGIVLNVGDDHYSTTELEKVFREFAGRCRSACVLPQSRRDALLPEKGDEGVSYVTYDDETPHGYRSLPTGMQFVLTDGTIVHSSQSGLHSAWNGSAVAILLKCALPEIDDTAIAAALGHFRGVRQRFEVLSPNDAPIAVINDYAHNPEKVAAAIRTARDRFGSPLGIVFQPHGFGALRFMEDALREHLAGVLKQDDLFRFLPVYYAGGTVSFHPTSEEVAKRFAEAGLPVAAIPDRATAQDELQRGNYRAWLVLGARDASLRTWSRKLAALPKNTGGSR